MKRDLIEVQRTTPEAKKFFEKINFFTLQYEHPELYRRLRNPNVNLFEEIVNYVEKKKVTA